MKRGGADNPNGTKPKASVALCASCDRCRTRKTKCDGKRPCGNCKTKYMKKNKLSRLPDDLDLSVFECVYSPAKRRGPVPGRVGQLRKENQAAAAAAAAAALKTAPMPEQAPPQQQPPLLANTMGGPTGFGLGQESMDMAAFYSMQQQQLQSSMDTGEPTNRRIKTNGTSGDAGIVPTPLADTIAAHQHLLHRSSKDGNRLRSYYRLSVDELFDFPPIPSDDEFAAKARLVTLSRTQQATLAACRFAEVALGALVHNEVSLAMELCNATVHSLRECSNESSTSSPCRFELARAYFLLGAFRAFRGDMERYFKYRRVSMKHLSKVEGTSTGAEELLAAMSYLDAWAYMMYNADIKTTPSIDGSIPEVGGGCGSRSQADTEKPGTRQSVAQIARNPDNQMWIQGAPSVYLNNEAPLQARSLDAISCAIRSCCDQANSRFQMIGQAVAAEQGVGMKDGDDDEMAISQESIMTPTAMAVMAHGDELCSRNMVLSAFTLLQQHEATNLAGISPQTNQGHHLIISALDAFLQNSDEDGSGGFTDSQIQSFLSVCNTAIENPLLLHHGGPTYHMVSNSAILLCHLLNGMHARRMSGDGGNSEMEAAVFEEILDTLLSVRKLLSIHRRKLPVKLRCHAIPRPSLGAAANGSPFVDLGNTIMCACRGCQGFVLMACSPCVAAERARTSKMKQQEEAAREAELLIDSTSATSGDEEDLDQTLYELENEFDLDDDALLGMLSRIVTAP